LLKKVSAWQEIVTTFDGARLLASAEPGTGIVPPGTTLIMRLGRLLQRHFNQQADKKKKEPLYEIQRSL
jgi:hypothetical protein